MADYFPPEVLHQILQWLPAKSICRFRSVCKSWNVLITSKFFIADHLKQNMNSDFNNHVLLRIVDINEYVHFLFHHYSSSIPSLPVTPLLKTKIASPRVLGICHGLICFIDDYYEVDHANIVLWNPSIRKFVTLPKPCIKLKEDGYFAIGFGSDSLNTDYKVVRIVYNRKGWFSTEMEVFSLRRGVWRRVEDLGLNCSLPPPVGFHACVNDRAHWIGWRENCNPQTLIVAFDMRYEVFERILLPDDLDCEFSPDVMLSVSMGCLAVTYAPCGCQCYFKLWVMKEYGVEGSWTLMYNVEELYTSFEVNRFVKNDSILIRRESNTWGIYDPENGRMMYLDLSGLGSSIYVDKYEESLVLLNHEDLESQPFNGDQVMDGEGEGEGAE